MTEDDHANSAIPVINLLKVSALFCTKIQVDSHPPNPCHLWTTVPKDHVNSDRTVRNLDRVLVHSLTTIKTIPNLRFLLQCILTKGKGK